MKIWNVLPAAGVAALLFAGPPARTASAATQATSTAAQVDDDTLESQIESVLKKDTILAPRDIDIESDRGRVTLTGTVRTAAEKARAGELAKIAGVAGIVNDIEVDPNVDRSKADTAAEKTKAGLNKAVDATVKGAQKAKEGVEKGLGESEKAVGTAAGKTADALDKTSDKMSDTSVTTRVRSGLSGDPALKTAAIQVQTQNRVVTLRGTVASAAAKTKAEAIAAKTEGVSRVVNDLVVQGQQ